MTSKGWAELAMSPKASDLLSPTSVNSSSFSSDEKSRFSSTRSSDEPKSPKLRALLSPINRRIDNSNDPTANGRSLSNHQFLQFCCPVHVVAVEDSILLTITAPDLENFAAANPDVRVALALKSTDFQLQMNSLPFFASLPQYTLLLLSSLFSVRRYSGGHTICHEGDPGDGFYVLAAGSIEVSARVPSSTSASTSTPSTPIRHLNPINQQKRFKSNTIVPLPLPSDEEAIYLGTLSAGDMIGEISLLFNAPRTATLRAVQDCTLLHLSPASFSSFLQVVESSGQRHLIEDLIQKFVPFFWSGSPWMTHKSDFFPPFFCRRTANSLKSIPLFSFLRRKQIGPLALFDVGCPTNRVFGGSTHSLSHPRTLDCRCWDRCSAMSRTKRTR